MHDANPIDRPARDALAAVILAYMRGEIQSTEFDRRKWEEPPLAETTDASVEMLCYDTWLIHDDLIDHPLSVPRETWDWLRRVVAFLRTDLRLTTVETYAWHPKQLVGLLGLLAIAGGAALGLLWSAWWPLAAAWVAAGSVGYFYGQLRQPQPSAAVQELGRWAPFRSRAEWESRQHLVGPGELPDYDPALHCRPVREPPPSPTVRLSWFLFGPLYGTLWLPLLLRREMSAIHLVAE